MSQAFYDALAIPSACELGKPIFKKLFLENGDLDVTDKKTLKDDIDRIRWLYTLKPSTLNVPAYMQDGLEYPEVAVLQFDLSNPTRAKRIASFVHRAIPYPLLLVLVHGETFAVGVANKRISQANKSKWVIEDEWLTGWIDATAPTNVQSQFMADCRLKNLSSLNFYAFYQSLVARVVALNAATRSGTYAAGTAEKTTDRRLVLAEIAALEREIAELRTQLKAETQFNRKLELNMAIKTRTDTVKTLENRL